MTWFSKANTLDELKKQYRKLALQYHPDTLNGDSEKMKQINNEYDTLFPAFQAIYNRTASEPSRESARESRSEFYTQNGWKGENYDFNRSTRDISKILREYVKRVYPDHKFSITTENFSGGSSIHVRLMTAPYEALQGGKRDHGLNPYCLEQDNVLTAPAKRIMQDVNRLINSYRRSDCDSMVDYFDVNFYYDLSVGKWDKPFEVVDRPINNKAQKTVSEAAIITEADFLTDVDIENDEDLEL